VKSSNVLKNPPKSGVRGEAHGSIRIQEGEPNLRFCRYPSTGAADRIENVVPDPKESALAAAIEEHKIRPADQNRLMARPQWGWR
jgi:hypothetical protein